MAKLDSSLDACPSVTTICLDVANGYSEFFIGAVKRVRERWPNHTIMAGNVVTNEMTEELIMHGADLNLARTSGATPLYAAAQNGYPDCCALLLGAPMEGARPVG